MVAKNHCLMKLRDKGKTPVELNDHYVITSDEIDNKKKHLDKESTLLYLENALQLLNSEQQQCITLFYLEKNTYQEITNKTGYSLLQVKSHIQNGKRNLKIMLERQQQHEQ
jgi:RNA polymerase sigma factor (sigma-70 family)